MDRKQLGVEFVDIREFSDWTSRWDKLIDECPDAWYWHLRSVNRYMQSIVGAEHLTDASFFVVLNGEPVGVVPMLIGPVQSGEYRVLEAGYNGNPLPWPCLSGSVHADPEIEGASISEAERRAQDAGAARISFVLSPPLDLADNDHRFDQLLIKKGYVDSGYLSHRLKLDENSLSRVRSRYIRYVKKFMPRYELKILERENMGEQFAAEYMQLHIKDAGGQFRPDASFQAQIETAIVGDGFFVAAYGRESGELAGALQIMNYKQSAFESSVAVNPESKSEYVSHLLRWKAIETLIARNSKSYEFGPRAKLPTWSAIPDDKNRGISFFKEGWARDGEKKVRIADKFFNRTAVEAFYLKMAERAAEHFGC